MITRRTLAQRAELRAAITAALRAATRDGLNSRQLSRRVGRDKSTINRALGLMQDDGLITATTDPFDGRFVLYTLTAKGAAHRG